MQALDFQTVIIGAGVSGIGAAIVLQKRGMNSFVILEQADELGGTWRDNRYPGVAVDIPSINYSFSYELNPRWSRFFAPGEEIQRYVKSVAEKHLVTASIRYGQSVEKIVFDESNNSWEIFLPNEKRLRCRYVISATGILNQPKMPNVEGLDAFKGKMMHTARWDDSYDYRNKRVGIIGTGASAVQVVPTIAPNVSHLEVYQRTPIWVMPKNDRELGKGVHFLFSYVPFSQLTVRFFSNLFLEAGTFFVVNYQKLGVSNKRLEAGLRRYLHSQVKDPELRKKLTPQYGFGCKRPSISNDYLKTFNRHNVSLITEGIERITETGIETCDGKQHELDLIVLGTGFKVMEQGNAPSYEVHGTDGLELGQFWHENRYQAFNSISIPKFPNFFLTYGPYSGGLNWFSMLESHLRFIMRCLDKAERMQKTRVEVKQAAHDAYFREMLRRSDNTVFKDAACVRANSYYIDHHGDASAGAPYIPMWRWFRFRFMSLSAYKFS